MGVDGQTERMVTRQMASVLTEDPLRRYPLYSGRLAVIVPQGMLPSPATAEGRHALQVADDARSVIDIVRAAMAAGVQGTLVDVTAFVADGDADIDAEIVAASSRRNVQQ